MGISLDMDRPSFETGTVIIFAKALTSLGLMFVKKN